ncbi:MAG: ABC transporter permease [Nanoarchaeota archaeon]|nr:ABC transporter permease [Nanoarchaeota archaeon]
MSFITNIKEKVEKKKEEKAKVKKVKSNFDIFVERPRLNLFIKLYYIFIKNIKLLIRSKTSAFIYFFGPLLIVFLIAIAFNTSTLYDLNVAVYSESYSDLSTSVVNSLADNQYNVIEIDSEEDCIDAVKFSDFQVCLVFPPNMLVDNSANNIIKIYVDNSRLNIANLISSQVSTKVSIEASSLSEGLVETILTTLDTTHTEIIETNAIVDDLISSTNSRQSSASSLSTELSGVDFSYTAFDVTTLDTALTSAISSSNATSTSFTTVRTLIDSLESSFNSATSALDTAESSVGTATTSLSGLSTSLTSDKADLEKAKSNLDVAIASINTVKITNVENIVSPIKTSIEPLSSSNSYLFYILPSLLVLLIMFVALLMSSSNIISEKTNQAFFRNYITPTNALYFLTGEFLSNFVVLLLQSIIIMGILFGMFSELGWQTFVIAGSGLVLIGSFFIMLGMLIGYIFNTKQAVTLATLTTGIILLFFSNTIIPLETLSSSMRKVLQYNPFVIGESILKKSLLFGSDFIGVLNLFILLFGFFVIVLLLTIISLKFSKKHISNS